jgi:hypothetical protein
MSTETERYQPPDTPTELVLAWLRRARASQMAHYEMANLLARKGQWLGAPVILITAVVGTSVFASIASDAISVAAKIAVGLLSVLATVLSSLQTFFKFSERAEKHRLFAARFGSVRRELEVFYASGNAANEPHYLAVLREKLDRLAEEAPHVPAKVLAAVQTNVRHIGDDPGTSTNLNR